MLSTPETAATNPPKTPSSPDLSSPLPLHSKNVAASDSQKEIKQNNNNNKRRQTPSVPFSNKENRSEVKESPIKVNHNKRPAPKPPNVSNNPTEVLSKAIPVDSKNSQVVNGKPQDNATNNHNKNIENSFHVAKCESKESLEQEIVLEDIEDYFEEKENYQENTANTETTAKNQIILSESTDNLKENKSVDSSPSNNTSVSQVTVSSNHSTIIDSVNKDTSIADTSHVSIVSIDNGKDVTIKTGEKIDDLEDTANSYNSTQINGSSPTIYLDSTRNVSSSNSLYKESRQTIASPSDVIIISNDYSPLSENASLSSPDRVQDISSISKRDPKPNETEFDHISMKTVSSDSSNSGKRIKVNLNLVSEETEPGTDTSESDLTRTSCETSIQSSANQSLTKNFRSNGQDCTDLEKQTLKSTSRSRKKESSDTGSCASFASLSSEKECKDDHFVDPNNALPLRKRKTGKVCSNNTL